MPSRTAHKKKWQNHHSQNSASKKTKLALLVLAFIIAIVILAQLFHLIQMLFSSWGVSETRRNYSWNGKFNINLVIHTNSTSLLSYNPKDQEITIINIPDRTFLEVTHGFGSWQLGAVYELGKSQNQADELLTDTLVNFFAVPMDGFLDFSGPLKAKTADQIVQLMRQNPMSLLTLLPNLKSNLTLWELIRLKFGLADVRFDKVKLLDLDKLNILEDSKLMDGTPILIADPVKLDSVTSGLKDPIIVSEHKSVAVFNATDHPQLANRWARLITNLGANVIFTANASQRLQKTQVQGESSQTLVRIKQIFDLNDKMSSSFEDLQSSRAQVNLLIGEDFSN